MRVYEAIGESLAREGVDVVFGLMGDGNIKLIPHLAAERGIRFYGARHEAAALAMADGYARVTGRVGVCTVTQGPGLTNTLTPLTQARKASTPLVVLAGEVSGRDRGHHHQEIDQGAVFAAAGVFTQPLRGPATVGEDVATAFRRARADSRPIGMNLPIDLQDAACELEAPRPGRDEPKRRVLPAGVDVAKAVDLIQKARRPVIVAGRGAVRAGARRPLEALAERIGALVVTSLPAKGFFDGNHYGIGIAGGFSSRLATRLMHEADCALVFGASLNRFTAKGGTQFRNASQVIHCDIDGAAIGAHTPATQGLVGDAAATAEALLAELEERGFRQDGFRLPAVKAEIAAHRPEDEFDDDSTGEAVDPRSLVIRLESILPRERVVVVDGGHFSGFPSMYLSVPDPASFVFALDFGAVGLGLGSALGAAVGRPDRLTVAVIGDGGLMMSLGDLDTAIRYSIPLVVVVLNDGAYGAEMHVLRALGLPFEESLFENPAFEAVAEAMGADGLTVRSLADLHEVERRVASLDRLLVLDCKVNREVCARWFAEAFVSAESFAR